MSTRLHAAAMRPCVLIVLVAAVWAFATPNVEAAPGDRSPDGLWVEVAPSALGTPATRLPRAFHAYTLNFDALAARLAAAPRETFGLGTAPSPLIIFLPLPDGTFAPVAVETSPVLGTSLAAQYPDIKTFVFRGSEDGSISGRMTLDTSTVQAIMRPPSDLARVSPLTTSTGIFYLSFLNHDRTDGADDFRLNHDEPRGPGGPAEPHIHDQVGRTLVSPSLVQMFALDAVAGSTLRQFRLAVATTGEYYDAREGANGILDVISSIVAEINNANAVFEQELAVRMSLDWIILYDDPTTDPYMAGSTACQLRDQNPAVVDAVVGSANYDIGFVFGTGGGNGCAWYVVCLADKARGAGLINTANVVAGGSTGLLLHEMGHQLGARHTFSTATGSCGNPGEFNQPSAYEPGSGSTIASYLGSCSPNDVDTTLIGSGQYYHTRSFDEILDNITNVVACGASLATGNTEPAVDAGADYTIPRGTPFTLTGSAVDPESDPLTFNWEQFDVAANQRPINTDTGEGPIFRSVPPATDASRTFPNLADLLSNTVRNGEVLPSTDRNLTFRLTARDNRVGGGGVAYDEAVLTVSGDPFFVTSPNGGETLHGGCQLPVTWTVGGGSVANNVSLTFSENGGQLFSPLLASTPNDGSAATAVPCTTTGAGRVKAAAIGNVFFDVSDNNFTVVSLPPTVDVQAQGGSVDAACQFEVPFTATIVDDCGANANDVSVQVFKQANNFTAGPPVFNAVQTSATTVSVTGSVLVSNVSSSPAVLSIEVSGKDACNLSSSDLVEVQVVDNTPPTISAQVQPASLWPPNHKLHEIAAMVNVTDNCPGSGFVLTSITSHEPDNGIGDGNTVNDIQDAAFGTADTLFRLRAERAGPGAGRIYSITFTASDASQNTATATPVVVVPHNKN